MLRAPLIVATCACLDRILKLLCRDLHLVNTPAAGRVVKILLLFLFFGLSFFVLCRKTEYFRRVRVQ